MLGGHYGRFTTLSEGGPSLLRCGVLCSAVQCCIVSRQCGSRNQELLMYLERHGSYPPTISAATVCAHTDLSPLHPARRPAASTSELGPPATLARAQASKPLFWRTNALGMPDFLAHLTGTDGQCRSAPRGQPQMTQPFEAPTGSNETARGAHRGEGTTVTTAAQNRSRMATAPAGRTTTTKVRARGRAGGAVEVPHAQPPY